MSVHSDFHPKYYTPWFSCMQNPVRVGVYQTTSDLVYHSSKGNPFGWSHSFWDGERWERFEAWMDYTSIGGFLWRGLDRNMQMPEGGILG